MILLVLDWRGPEAKRMLLADKLPSGDVTVADRVKDVLTQQKIEKAAPAYLDKLKADGKVEILNPDLKAAVAAAVAAAAAAATNAPLPAPRR